MTITEFEAYYKDFLRKNPNVEYQVPPLTKLFGVEYGRLAAMTMKLKRQGFVFVVNPLDNSTKRKFKLSDRQQEHRQENENFKSLKEGETLEMGVGNNE